VDDHAQRPTGASGYGRLDAEVLFGDALAGLIDALLRRLPERADKTCPRPRSGVALLAAEAELGADAKESREHHALQKLPGVIIDLILEPGITRGVGGRQIVDLDRRSVGHDDALPASRARDCPKATTLS
jgi:hypothetical protein